MQTTARAEVTARHLEAYELARRLKNAGAMVAATDALVAQFCLEDVEPSATDEPLTIVIRRFSHRTNERPDYVSYPSLIVPDTDSKPSEPPVIDDISDAEAARVMALFEQHGQSTDDEQDAAEFLRSLLSEQESEHVAA